MTVPALSVSDLTHDYRTVRALESLTFTAPPGRIGLVGANGAGKSTLIKLLLGLLRPTTGELSLLGAPPDARQRVGYMPEASALPLDQTASDFVAYAAELAGLPPRAARRRASETLFLVGLEEERFRYIGDFSTGMRQRVKLAQAIVHDPALVFLDEPTSGLDPDGREAMLDLIRRLGSFGISVVFSTHIIADVERTCEWVVMLDAGRLVRSSPLEKLGSRDMIRLEVWSKPELVAARLEERLGGVTRDRDAILVAGATDDTFSVIQSTLAELGAGIRWLGETHVTLEEAFFLEPEVRP